MELSSHQAPKLLRGPNHEVLKTRVIGIDQQQLGQSAGQTLDGRAVALGARQPQLGPHALGQVGRRSQGMADFGKVVRFQPQADGLLFRFEGRDLPAGNDAVKTVDQGRLQKGVRQPANEVGAGRCKHRFAAVITPLRLLLQLDVRHEHQAAFRGGATIAPGVDALLQVAFELGLDLVRLGEADQLRFVQHQQIVSGENHKAGRGVDLQTLSVLPACGDLHLILAQIVSLAEQGDEPPAALVRPPTGQDRLLADFGDCRHGREKVAAPGRVFLQVILEIADRLPHEVRGKGVDQHHDHRTAAPE